jgi:hypothetical protein
MPSFWGRDSARGRIFWATISVLAFSLIYLFFVKLLSDEDSRCSAAFLQSGHWNGKFAMSTIYARFMLKQEAWNQSSQESQPIMSKVSGCRQTQYNLFGSEKGMYSDAISAGSARGSSGMAGRGG